ncbi:hypothetical protein [Methanobrevibacter sp.]|uniref:hypothetical protein n=1 Tax=Methanobrevibacter sp. TaxID=66852 RepID=UPI0025D4850E|nr:hypothetical protein [Methanobrevibacter sp.]MBQ2666876.1 hypothetical protein [Methanobrevibacter sp.]
MDRYGIQVLIVIQCILLVPTISEINDYLITHDIFCFLILSLFYVMAYSLTFPFIFKEPIEQHYEVLSEVHMFSTYQYQTLLFSVWLPALLYLILGCSYFMGFFSKSLQCSVFFIIPIISLIFGRKPFNDSSCIVNNEILLGYPPIYPIISLIAGIFGFSFILNSDINQNIVLIITLIFQAILVLPHVINRIAPFEIRTKKGCLYFLAITIALYALLIFLTIGKTIFYPTNSIINAKTILDKIITYGISMIIVYLFYKQAQKMNKKKK